jgi:hypothetical protein
MSANAAGDEGRGEGAGAATCVDVMDAHATSLLYGAPAQDHHGATSRGATRLESQYDASVQAKKRKRVEDEAAVEAEAGAINDGNDRIDVQSSIEDGSTNETNRGGAESKKRVKTSPSEEEDGPAAPHQRQSTSTSGRSEESSSMVVEEKSEDDLAWERMWSLLTPTQKAVRFILLNKQLNKN